MKRVEEYKQINKRVFGKILADYIAGRRYLVNGYRVGKVEDGSFAIAENAFVVSSPDYEKTFDIYIPFDMKEAKKMAENIAEDNFYYGIGVEGPVMRLQYSRYDSYRDDAHRILELTGPEFKRVKEEYIKKSEKKKREQEEATFRRICGDLTNLLNSMEQPHFDRLLKVAEEKDHEVYKKAYEEVMKRMGRGEVEPRKPMEIDENLDQVKNFKLHFLWSENSFLDEDMHLEGREAITFLEGLFRFHQKQSPKHRGYDKTSMKLDFGEDEYQTRFDIGDSAYADAKGYFHMKLREWNYLIQLEEEGKYAVKTSEEDKKIWPRIFSDYAVLEGRQI